MSRHPSRERNNVTENPDALAVIREEQLTPIDSNTNVDTVSKSSAGSKSKHMNKTGACPTTCSCQEKGGVKFGAAEVEEMLKEKEAKLRAEFAQQLEQEEKSMRERFDFILQNEQVRTSHMLREAHRERQEKVQALQAQLECKNMAGLMYVMCSERRKSKLEKLRMANEQVGLLMIRDHHRPYTPATPGVLQMRCQPRGLRWDTSSASNFTGCLTLHAETQQYKHCCFTAGLASKMVVAIRADLAQEYTNYIHALQSILSDGQSLILHLSRGYKTAAKVDQEWRDKMKVVIKEFQEYVYHFAGGSPDTNQYIFDIPALLKTQTPVEDNPNEDPCDCNEDNEFAGPEGPEREKTWWERLEGEGRPFVMFGDMSEFKPPQRREVLGTIKAAKTAPPKWKEYVFNEMFLKDTCPNADSIKEEYPKRLPVDKWECRGQKTPEDHSPIDEKDIHSRESSFRRYTTTSMEMRAAMGSILRMITASNYACGGQHTTSNRANLLAARDSMEIASTTRLREKHRESINTANKCISISFGGMQTLHDGGSKDENEEQTAGEDSEMLISPKSLHQDSMRVINGHVPDVDHTINYEKTCPMDKCQRLQVDSFLRSLPAYMRASPFTHFEHTFEDYETCSPVAVLSNALALAIAFTIFYPHLTPCEREKRSLHQDSMRVINGHVPDVDHTINYEKTCPMDKCQRLQVDSFLRSLPAYMRASPFTHFEHTFEDYETCSPDQLEILKQRLEDKKTKGLPATELEVNLLDEWAPDVEGVGVQTSEMSVSDLPPCTCNAPSPTPATSVGRVFNVEDLIPVKEAMDEIHRECFYDNRIEFDRFKVIGQENSDSM
ncbi:hypothetical protein MSG28_014094 [Choristoneura fumiferana]|uniref:Uncharacterized protein n=1 Tax=Choristoneura fumiferana TaxID=7141 RepID=A0ACC0JFS9_CHOFU|nr:hypothetical protein MSG28_014094 [Choristoneura fumiferana]